MKRASKGEVLTREPHRPNRVARGRAPAAGAGGAPGGPARRGPVSPKEGQAPPPKAGPPPRSGRGARQYDDIDVEFYLDSMGGE